MIVTRAALSPTEQAVWDAFGGATAIDLRPTPDDGPKDAPLGTVRASVLTALLRGANPPAAGQSAGLRLAGARVTGVLDLNCATVAVPVQFQHCVFDERPDFTDATTRGLRFTHCELPGFDGRLLRADGDVDFRGAVITGRTNLIRARITGELRLTGATLRNPDGWALFAGGMVVESACYGSMTGNATGDVLPPMTVDGGIRFAGARFLSGLFLDGVTIRRPDERALHGDNLTVVGRMSCGHGFVAEGAVRLPHSRIEGELSFAGATLTGLTLTNTVVDDLNLRLAAPPTGPVDLRHTRCTVLRDDPSSWPASLALDGLSYEALDGDIRVAQRLRWLRRDPDGYRPQPYEHLAALLRRLGADADARKVLLHKQRRRRAGQRWPARVVGALLDATVGYGYRPWRAALWLVALLAAGTAVFSVWRPVPDGTARPFDAIVYTMDLLVPISVFGLRDSYVPVGGTRWLAYLLTAAGWLLATALVAGITRALRRD